MLRIALPGWLLERAAASATGASRASGSRGGEPAADRRFGPLEQAVHRCVFRFLPVGAESVRLEWDAVRLEVVARFSVPRPGSRRGPSG